MATHSRKKHTKSAPLPPTVATLGPGAADQRQFHIGPNIAGIPVPSARPKPG